MTRNWSALFSTLVDGMEAPLPEEEEEDTSPPVVVVENPSPPAPAAVEDDEDEGSTFLGIEIVREAAPAAPTTTVTMERLPDIPVVEQVVEGPRDPAQTAFPRREERILKDSAMLGIEIVRESSSDEEDVEEEEDDMGGIEIVRDASPAVSTVVLGDGVELPASSLAEAYGLRASKADVDPRAHLPVCILVVVVCTLPHRTCNMAHWPTLHT